MMDKREISTRLWEIIRGKLTKRSGKKLSCVKIRDADLAREIHDSEDDDDFEKIYDSWMNMREEDDALTSAAMNELPLAKHSPFSDLITASIDSFEKSIKYYGGFPGRVAEPLEVAEDFTVPRRKNRGVLPFMMSARAFLAWLSFSVLLSAADQPSLRAVVSFWSEAG